MASYHLKINTKLCYSLPSVSVGTCGPELQNVSFYPKTVNPLGYISDTIWCVFGPFYLLVVICYFPVCLLSANTSHRHLVMLFLSVLCLLLSVNEGCCHSDLLAEDTGVFLCH